jgi:hypothetical protein
LAGIGAIPPRCRIIGDFGVWLPDLGGRVRPGHVHYSAEARGYESLKAA